MSFEKTQSNQDAEQRMGLVDTHNLQLGEAIEENGKRKSSGQRDGSDVYTVTWMRWFMLFSYVLSMSSTAVIMMNFAAISVTVANIYEVNVTVINFNVMIFLIAFVVFNFPTIVALEKSMKWTFRISATLLVFGAWLRYLIIAHTQNIYLMIIGQGLIGIFQPFLGNGASKLATRWFADNERALATAIGSLALPLGCIIGMVLGPIFIHDSLKNDHVKGKQVMEDYLFFSAMLSTGMNASTILFFQERPAVFPSEVAKDQQRVKFDMKKDFMALAKNKNYIFLAMTYSLMYGVYTCLGACLDSVVMPYGFTSVDASIFGATFIVSGIIGSFIFSNILDKHKTYKYIFRASCFGTLGFAAMLIGTFLTGNLTIVTINIGCMGFFILPILPVGYNFACEVTYPVSEVMSNGMMMLTAQLTGVVLTAICSVISEVWPRSLATVLVACVGLAAFLSLFVWEDLRRINVKKSAAIEQEEERLVSISEALKKQTEEIS